jgi:hypothetical protein
MSPRDYEQLGIPVIRESRRREHRTSDVYCGQLNTVPVPVFYMQEAHRNPAGYKQWDKHGRREFGRRGDRNRLFDCIQ